ncbi:MAG: DivIVA domain-containing protein [Corallococcus sp.]|nr:DivIVA domain-containing protein [Bacillota bacterium]MCM1534248.1 DivIVA domain-containing protein [Corallococcus sp.]
MEFKRVFRGYDVDEVDKYISETEEKERTIRRAQRERIDELSDENYSLRQQLNELKANREAVSEALIISQNAAKETELNAKEYSDRVLFQAKKFYATWQAYSKTIAASFTDDELKAFNGLQRKIERAISAYEKERFDDAQTAATDVAEVSVSADFDERSPSESELDATSPDADEVKQTGKLVNPIEKVESASKHTIDLRELTRTDESLEDLCADLGLIVRK